ncbi:MAG: hypothetical protein R3A52_16785 [Polyangiales bacterium]
MTTVVPGVPGVDSNRFIGAWPSRADVEALARVAGSLDDGTPWSAWVSSSHVVQSLDGDAGMTPLELAIEANLDALHAVCRAPRTLLRYDDDRSPVSQARRVSSRSIADLVSRPSDWERRTLRGVRPARVLSVVSEDDWDLYENRVAARLIDRLLALLVPRLQQLAQMKALLDEGHDFTDETRGSHWRARRLSQTWERVAADDAVRSQVRATSQRLTALTDALRTLLTSTLYTHVLRGAQVEDALRPTNILSNDFHYRRVAELWRRVALTLARAAPTRADALRLRRLVSAHFDAFSRLLVLQALHGFGYRPTSSEARFADGRLRLHGPRGELELLPLPDGALVLKQGDRALPIVALPVSPAGDDAAVVEATKVVADDALVLLYGRLAAGVKGDTAAVLAGWSRPRVLLVSPWSLDAVERTARVLGAWDAAGRLDRYPPRVDWRGAPPRGLPDWARSVAGTLIAVRPPSEDEREAPSRATTVPGTRVVSDDREQAKARALGALRAEAQGIGWLATCPVCRGADVVFDDRFQPDAPVERQTVWCRCRGCTASWGLRACGRCQRGRFAALDPGLNLECPADAASIDRAYGRDLWARPQRGADDRRAYSCPHCEAG